MPLPSCTEDTLDALNSHTQAERDLMQFVLVSIEDGKVSLDERRGIARRMQLMNKAKGRLRTEAERCHKGFTLARSVLWTGELTPKIARRERELQQGIDELDEQEIVEAELEPRMLVSA